MEIDTRSYELIIRMLNGEITDQERVELDHWLMDPECNRTFNSLRKLWSATPSQYFLTTAMKNEDWEKIQKQINFNQSKKWYRVAAVSLILLSSVAFGWYNDLFFGSNQIVYQTVDEKQEFMLPDCTKVTLNKNSTLSLGEGFNRKDRKVQLTGEGFFEVMKDDEKKFIVSTGKTATTVLGTSFNILTYKDSTLIDVVTGRIVFASASDDIFLTNGQSAVYREYQHKIKPVATDPNAYSWKTGRLVFNNTPLQTVLSDLSRHFQISIEAKGMDISDLRLTTIYDHYVLEDVLKELSLTLQVDITRDHKTYQITPKP